MTDKREPKRPPMEAYWGLRFPVGGGIVNMGGGDGYTSNVPAEDPNTLTAAKLLAIARSMPKQPPRVIQVEPFHRVEVYTGDAVLDVAEPNPAYDLIPSGKVVHGIVPRFGFLESWRTEEVVFVRADEWRKANP